jgi:hypothetical protein
MFTLRGVVACALFCIAVVLGTFSFRSFADPTPPSGTLSPSTPNLSITYTDGPLVENPSGVLGAPVCTVQGQTIPNGCSDFVITINASSLAATHNFTWTVSWPVPNVDMDIFIEKPNGTLVANNNSTTDPSAITLPIPPDGTVYHLIVSSSVGTSILTGTASLTLKYPTSGQGAGTPARYINYSAGTGQADGDNEPSLGVDWNPNVASLKHDLVNRGGVAFFTTGAFGEYRINFDDCSSPAVNLWEDVTPTLVPTGLDPIGFVDHYTTLPLGISYPPPHTPGRVFALDLGAGDSLAAYSDDDGGTYVPGGGGGAGQGPDHESLGGGPFHSPIPTPPAPAYPNAIYYASQNGVQNAGCSRSDDGGSTFGPAVPFFNPSVCGGGIHGHIKVSPQGTVYIPNSSCAAGSPLGANGVARSTDNGITWTEMNVPNSTGSQDPSLGIGQNNVGKAAGQVPNTIYLGWISADSHAHAAHSEDEGATWHDDIDVGSIFGIEKAVFAEMVAGDDNRAAYAFLGTVPGFAPTQVWHAFIANTYDGGHSWILVDLTPDDPVQIGGVCLLGLGCDGSRNLLDFNDITVDAEGRVLFGYTDGCLNCTNQRTQQSVQAHGTIARQSGGRRLFSFFDPVEPAPPAAPQVLSAVRISGPPAGVLVTWLKPDNGGSPILSYNIYRGTASGTETLLASVTGEDTNKYLDQTAASPTNYFYRVTAVNAVTEGSFCREVNINGTAAAATACLLPFLTEGGAGVFGAPPNGLPSDPTNGQLTLQRIAMGEPFTTCADKSITFLMKVANLNPTPAPNAVWRFYFRARDTAGALRELFVQMDTTFTPTPSFNYGYRDPIGTGSSTTQCLPALGTCPVTGNSTPDGTIRMKLDVSQPLEFFSSTNTSGVPDFTVNIPIGTNFTAIAGETDIFLGAGGNGSRRVVQTNGGTGTYTTIGNIAGCNAITPLAVLSATPTSGPPGTSVNFDGTGSTEPVGACGTINSYTINFGDGSPPSTNGTGLFSHPYNNPGTYGARLTVSDTIGHVSTNQALTVITIAGNPPPLNSVVSRKDHSGTAYDVTLQKDATTQPRGVECRTGGANGVYTIVFNFQNNLVGAIGSGGGNASVILGPGSIVAAGTGIGPAQNQFTVNLTGVTNGNYVTVGLENVSDVGGNIGSVATTMGALLGDTTGDGSVNSADISQTKSRSGQVLSTTNFRSDVTVDGSINSADISQVKSKSGTALPSTP